MGPLYELSPTYGTFFISLYVEMRDSTTGDLKPNVAHADLTARAVMNRGLPVPVSTSAIAAPDTALSVPRTTLGWVQVDATNCPGLYRADLPDSLFSPVPQELGGNDSIANTGNALRESILTINATGCKSQHIRFTWVANSPNRPIILDTLGAGLTSLSNLSDEGSLGMALRNFLMGYQLYTGTTTSAVPSGTVGPRLSSAGLDGVVLEALTGAIQAINARQGLQLILAAAAGGREGAGLGTTVVTSPGGTDRAEYDTPGDGNRTVNSTSLTA